MSEKNIYLVSVICYREVEMFKGSCVALVTPFKDGSVDYETIKKLVSWHIEQGTDCIVPCGCTGEAATLNLNEHMEVMSRVINEVAGFFHTAEDKAAPGTGPSSTWGAIKFKGEAERVKVMPGTGSNSTQEAIELTEFARKAGSDGALIITPYYNKPTQEGLYRHYKKIAESVDIPVCLYNVPSRTGVNMLPETVARLSGIENIVAIKEASGKIAQCAEIIRLCGDNITLLSGDDSLTYSIMALGGKGVVSVLANLVPEVVLDMTGSFLKGDREKALQLHYKWLPLMDALFIETNPAPVKEALGMMGRIKPELRLPLVNLTISNKKSLEKVMLALGLL